SLERIDVSKSSAGGRRSSGSSRESRAAGSILLNAVWIEAEQKRDLARVVGIEKDLDLILAVDVVPIGMCRAYDVAMDLPGANAEVDRLGRIPHQHLGGLFGRTAI